jgi:hypothetical protein
LCPNVIIFSGIKETLINQIPTSEDENCRESEDGEIKIEGN